MSSGDPGTKSPRLLMSDRAYSCVRHGDAGMRDLCEIVFRHNATDTCWQVFYEDYDAPAGWRQVYLFTDATFAPLGSRR